MHLDHTSTVVSADSIAESETKPNVLLKNVTTEFSNNELYLNVEKIKFIIFHSEYIKKDFNIHVFG